jgi:tyrosyl-tRNA synthetase
MNNIKKKTKSIDNYKKCSATCDTDNEYSKDWIKRREDQLKILFKHDFKKSNEIYLNKAKKSNIVKKFNKCMISQCRKELNQLIDNYAIILETNKDFIVSEEFKKKREELIADLKNVKKWSDKRVEEELYRLAIKRPELLYIS